MSENAAVVFAQDDLDGIAFVGNALAPFFLNDPSKGTLDEQLAAFAALDVSAAAEEWPFVADETAVEALALMRRGAIGAAASSEGADALMWEYRRLFVGPQALPVPPWGSVYTDRDCVVFGGTTLELRAWMRKHGIERTGDERTPEDHIGLLLSMLSWAAQVKPELAGELLALHILPWSSHMLDQLVAAAKHPFYEGLARLAKASLEGMQDEFDLDVITPRFYR